MALADTAQLAVELKLKDEMSGALSHAQTQLAQFDQKVKTTAGGLTGAFQRSLGTVDQNISKAFSHMGQGLRTAAGNIEKLGLAAGGLAIGGAAAAVKWAGDFEAQLHTINTVAGLTPQALGALGDQLRKVARDTGLSLDEITSGYYDLVSAGVKGSLAVTTLNDAVSLGIGGLATTGQTIDLLTTAINSYSLDATGATKATDMFAQAIADGKVKADQIAATFSDIAPLAVNNKIGIDQIAASYGFLTAKGVDAGMAMTQMKRALIELAKPNKEVQALTKQTGEDFLKTAQTKGLVVALQDLRDAADKAGVKYTDLFGRVEGLNYFLETTGPNYAGYAAELKKIGDASGTAAAQMSERQQGLNFQLARLKAEVKDAGITIGSALIPKLVPLFESFNRFLDTHQGDIQQFAASLANAFEGVAKWIERLDFNQIADDLKAAGTFARGIIEAFLAAPPWLQQAVVTGWGLNKLTGGAVVNVGLDLAKAGLAGSIFGRGSSPANPLWVQSVGGPIGGPGDTGITGFFASVIASAKNLLRGGSVTAEGVVTAGAGAMTGVVTVDQAMNLWNTRILPKLQADRAVMGSPTSARSYGEHAIDRLVTASNTANNIMAAGLTQGHRDMDKLDGTLLTVVGSKLDTLHKDFEAQRAQLASKDAKERAAAAAALAKDILSGVGGALSTEHLRASTLSALKTETDPAARSALKALLAAIDKKLPGREYIRAQEQAADRIKNSNLSNGEKIRRLQDIMSNLKDKTVAGYNHVADEVSALKSHIDDVTAAVQNLHFPTAVVNAANAGNTSSSRERQIIVQGGTSHRSNTIANTRATRWQSGTGTMLI